mmetsp:Transcript_11234/g.19928  ORF Transcript_11234/g.19928 Transcript_11234/m.19928 type:complete len:82 (-) Transcript_11234:52-297(-)
MQGVKRQIASWFSFFFVSSLVLVQHQDAGCFKHIYVQCVLAQAEVTFVLALYRRQTQKSDTVNESENSYEDRPAFIDCMGY